MALAAAVAVQVGLVAPLTLVLANRRDLPLPLLQVVAAWLPTLALVLLGALAVLAVAGRLEPAGRPLGSALAVAAAAYLYLQFHLLVWDYGRFDGQPLAWARNAHAPWVEGACLLALMLGALRFPRRMATVGGQLLVALVLVQATVTAGRAAAVMRAEAASPEDTLNPHFAKTVAPRTLARIDRFSSTRNVIVVVLDTFQSQVFEQLLARDPGRAEAFPGFVYFKNAAGVFPYTSMAMPALWTGAAYRPGEAWDGYLARVDGRRLDRRFAAAGYDVAALPLYHRADYLRRGGSEAAAQAALRHLWLFRHTPHVLKRRVADPRAVAAWLHRDDALPPTAAGIDRALVEAYLPAMAVDTAAPAFRFLHLYAAHPPAENDAECRPRDAAGHGLDALVDQADCVLRWTEKLLERLRALGIYDRSLVAITADHGSQHPVVPAGEAGAIPPVVLSRAQPLLLIKDLDAAGALRVSGAPVALTDLAPTLLRRAGLEATDGVDALALGEDQPRRRPFFYLGKPQQVIRGEVGMIERYWLDGDVRRPADWHRGRLFVDHGRAQPLTAEIDFGHPAHRNHLGAGWSQEGPGVESSWTLAEVARLVARLPPTGAVEMTIRLYSPIPDQVVRVEVGGREVGRLEPEVGWALRDYTVTLPAPPSPRRGASVIDLRIARQARLGERDPRRLGIHVASVRFTPAAASPGAGGSAPADGSRAGGSAADEAPSASRTRGG